MLTPDVKRARENRICHHGYRTIECPIHKWDVIPVIQMARGNSVGGDDRGW